MRFVFPRRLALLALPKRLSLPSRLGLPLPRRLDCLDAVICLSALPLSRRLAYEPSLCDMPMRLAMLANPPCLCE